jgi:hypothetical protein
MPRAAIFPFSTLLAAPHFQRYLINGSIFGKQVTE